MEEEKMPQKVFETLTKEERKLLQNEFSKSVDTRYKVLRWSGIILLLPMLISGGFAMYYMINVFFTGFIGIEFEFYICTAIFMLCSCGTMLLSSPYHMRFRKWLKENKNIVIGANTINK